MEKFYELRAVICVQGHVRQESINPIVAVSRFTALRPSVDTKVDLKPKRVEVNQWGTL